MLTKRFPLDLAFHGLSALFRFHGFPTVAVFERARFAAAIAARPASVFGPVEQPPCNRHRAAASTIFNKKGRKSGAKC
jgi:hypothetical protein